MKVARALAVPLVRADVGIEVEVEGRDLPKEQTDLWRVEHDGSLRGEDNAEYVLRQPSKIEDLHHALASLQGMFEEEGSVVDLSRRTSTHVHINCTQLEMIELFNFITLLLIFEELLVGWCGGDRDGNLFCLQSKDAEGMLEVLKKFAKSRDRSLLRDNIRYSAINLAALRKYGSIELRSLEGTIDEKRILTWVGVLLRLRSIATNYADPTEIVNQLSEFEIAPFSKQVLGPYAKDFFKGKGKVKKVLGGVRRAQDIAYTVDWNIHKQIDKPQPAEAKFWRKREDIYWKAVSVPPHVDIKDL